MSQQLLIFGAAFLIVLLLAAQLVWFARAEAKRST